MVKITPDIKELFEKAIIAFSTASKLGVPNTVAVACCKVVSENQVLITDNFFNKSRQNLLENDSVSLAFWNVEQSLEGAGYQFKGTAEVFTNGIYKDMVDKMECNHGLAHKAGILVTISEIWDLATPSLICKS
jgi:predicted pyridoxine 5'-phosphate oxidase superfamily flavin-nucleotide-binding protein